MQSFKLSLFFCFSILYCFVAHGQVAVSNPKNEFRAIWIATVANIDWPKSGLASIEKQKIDYIEILETYKKLNYNAVIVQIRSVGDAFYCTDLAPWSRYLTGNEGKAPTDNIDILKWMITESHNRGFEFHAWLNPFRATMSLDKSQLNESHDFFTHKDWMVGYGNRYYYNPGLPEVRNHLVKVIEEVVNNYDIDAVHFDDYFYPYKVKGQVFNDTKAYTMYGNSMDLADWRRQNVNDFIKATSIAIKNRKPWVQFGISPFGVWRNQSQDPRGSDTVGGSCYDDLFADPLAWIDNNWIDYIIPQIYWSIDHKKVPYHKLIKWWSENSKNTTVYIGNAAYKINADSDECWSYPNEFPNQINLTRTYKNLRGNAIFSAKSFMNKNKQITTILSEDQYKYMAIPSVVPNLQREVLDTPQIVNATSTILGTTVVFSPPLKTKIRYVLVYEANEGIPLNTNDSSQLIDKIALNEAAENFRIEIPKKFMFKKSTYAFTYTDYYGNESTPTQLGVLNKTLTQYELSNKIHGIMETYNRR